MFYSFEKPSSTREAILQNAFREMYERGFTQMSISHLCEKSGVSKGTFFHYFKSKKELGFAVIREVLVPFGLSSWIVPLKEQANPLKALTTTVELHRTKVSDYEIKFGCAFQNFLQELSPIDEDFRSELTRLFEKWVEEIAKALERGKKQGFVDPKINSKATAMQVLSQFYGALTLGKGIGSKKHFVEILNLLQVFIDSLRLRSPRTLKNYKKRESSLANSTL